MKMEFATSKTRKYQYGMASSEKKSTSLRNDRQTGSHQRLKALSKILSKDSIRTSTNIIFDSDDDEDDIIILNDNTCVSTENECKFSSVNSILMKSSCNEIVIDSDTDTAVDSDTETVILSSHSSEDNSYKTHSVKLKTTKKSVGNGNNQKSIINAILEERLLCLADESMSKVHNVLGECEETLSNTCKLNSPNKDYPIGTVKNDNTENFVEKLFNSNKIKIEPNLNVLVNVEKPWEKSVSTTEVETGLKSIITETTTTKNNLHTHGQINKTNVVRQINNNDLESTKQTVFISKHEANWHHVQNAHSQLNPLSMVSSACQVAQILKGYLPIVIQNYLLICAEDENYNVLNSVINTSMIYHITQDQFKVIKNILETYWLDKAFYEQLRFLVSGEMNIIVKSFDFFLKSLVGYILASANPYITTALPDQSNILAISGHNYLLNPEFHQHPLQPVSIHQQQRDNTVHSNLLPNTGHYVSQNSYLNNNQNVQFKKQTYVKLLPKSNQIKPKKTEPKGKNAKCKDYTIKIMNNKANHLKCSPSMSQSHSEYKNKILTMPPQTVHQVSEKVVSQCTEPETKISESGASNKNNSNVLQYSSAYPIFPNQFLPGYSIPSIPQNFENCLILPFQPAQQLGHLHQQHNNNWNNDEKLQDTIQSSNTNTYNNTRMDVKCSKSQQICYSWLNNNSNPSSNKLSICNKTQTLTSDSSNIHHYDQIRSYGLYPNYRATGHLKVNPELKKNMPLTKKRVSMKSNAKKIFLPKLKERQFSAHTDESNKSNLLAPSNVSRPESFSIESRGCRLMIPNKLPNLRQTQAYYGGANNFEYQTAHSLNKNCACCGKATKLRCSRCSDTYFCSILCQTRMWSAHEKNCRPKMEEPRV